MNTPIFLPLEKTYTPFICVLIAMTVRATHSSSSICMEASTLRSGVTKKRQISGSSVMAGVFRVGIRSSRTISIVSRRKASQFFLAARSSRNICRAKSDFQQIDS